MPHRACLSTMVEKVEIWLAATMDGIASHLSVLEERSYSHSNGISILKGLIRSGP